MFFCDILTQVGEKHVILKHVHRKRTYSDIVNSRQLIT